MTAYYNEVDPYAAQWLRNLIAKGLIANGEVDTRSIVDVTPDDLKGFTQCHFFAGIGGWSHALRLAEWPDDRPIWTGSCPCQPFSVAGKGAGTDDPRHLWPHFHRLITAVRPLVVMGEQVAGAAGYGWLDGVRADLAREGYASRGVDIPACAVDAPHIRQRLYWVALDMADASNQRRKRDAGKLGEPQPLYEREEPIAGGSSQETFDSRSRNPSHMENANGIGWAYGEHAKDGWQTRAINQPSSGSRSLWADHIWIAGSDGKARRSKPGLPLLAHGIPNRVGRLRAYGNAIVPPLAAEVIRAFAESWGRE
jgi:DNA (cytosine-5)-methyltransferase 1